MVCKLGHIVTSTVALVELGYSACFSAGIFWAILQGIYVVNYNHCKLKSVE